MTFSSETIRAWVDVDLAALVANARTIAAISGSRLLPMVKANGYGLGAVEIARALEAVDPWGFGVASVEEAGSLRASGIARPILLLTPLLPHWIERCLELDLRPSIGDPAALDAWTARSKRPFHLEIDTGMSRSGVRWDDRAALGRLRGTLADAAGWEGAFTQFLAAESDAAITERQWTRFQETLDSLPRRPSLVHAANSAAALRGRCYAADLVRPGIFLYGGSAGGTHAPRPVAALRGLVVATRSIGKGDTVGYDGTWQAERPCVVATLSIGYADGLPRSPGIHRSVPREVEIRGKRALVIGRVSMDMCMVLGVPDIAIGDIATVYGGIVSIDHQAEAAGTISYELLTRLGPRVPRRYQRST